MLIKYTNISPLLLGSNWSMSRVIKDGSEPEKKKNTIYYNINQKEYSTTPEVQRKKLDPKRLLTGPIDI